jgi:hypothetical protein
LKADQVLARLKERLRVAIKSHEEHAKKVTDTGTMWRSSAYREVLEAIEKWEREAEG